MENRPLPDINDANRPYWDAARRGELLLPRCAACGDFFFPPRTSCPHCYSQNIDWAIASGRGELISFSQLHIEPFAGYTATFPYVLAVVKLAEGPQMMANIINCDPETLRIGDAVKMSFEERAEGVKVPQFEPSVLSHQGVA